MAEIISSEFGSEFAPETPNSFDAIYLRILQTIGSTKDSDLAAALGITPQSVHGQKKKTQIPDSWYVKIAEDYGASVKWLKTGVGEMHRTGGEKGSREAEWDGQERRGEHDRRRRQLQTFVCDNCELVMVPMLDAVLSGGTGSLETGGDVLKTYAFRYDFLKRKGNPKEMGLFRVSGDSMSNDILDNDVVLIDKSQNQPVPGKIFAVSIHGLTYLKQVDAGQDGLILSSVNDRYPPIKVDMRGDEQDGVYIIGRMVWLCREFD